MKKRITSCFILLCIMFSMLPATALATEETFLEDTYIVCVNPLYAGVVTEAVLVKPSRIQLYADNTGGGEYYDAQTAGKQIREDLVARDTTIIVNACCESSADTYKADRAKLTQDVLEYAMMHTGEPNEGDYLRWHYEGFYADFSNSSFEDGMLRMTITYTMTYLTTAAQESEMDTAVENLLDSLNVSHADDYTKLKTVYDFICSEVKYDNENTYLLKHTAYAALINRTAVCQGYATLLYRLVLALGVDCRLIAGTANSDYHGWNIAEIDDLYYNLDSTWDAGSNDYQYFLVSPDNFEDHTRLTDYDTASFHKDYPMADTNFVYDEPVDGNIVASGKCGENLTWSLDMAGMLTISGTGDMWKWSSESNISWYSYRDQIKTVVVETDVTTISNYAFASCFSLIEITFKGNAPEIAEDAFYGVTATCYYPAGNSSWTDDVMQDYGADKLTWHIYCDSHMYEVIVTAPTCTEKGYTTYTCTCGDSYAGDYVDAAGHDFKDGECVVCGTADPDYKPEKELLDLVGANMQLGNNLSMNFFVSPDDLDEDEDYYAVITMDYADSREDYEEIIEEDEWSWYEGEQLYYVTMDQVAAKEMTDEITVTIYNDEDEQVSVVWVDSVRAYAMRMLAKETNEIKAALYVEMLNYGAAAQEYFDYDEKDLANEDLTDEQKAGLIDLTLSSKAAEGEGYAGMNLQLESSIIVNFFFKTIPEDHDDMYAIVTYVDHYGDRQTFTVEGENFGLHNGLWYVSVNKLVVADCSELVTVKVYDGNNDEFANVVDSMENYIGRMSAKDPLYEAIMRFAISARSYLHSI